MSLPIRISIPNPCHENWDDMTPADKGRFCASCQKTVLDFTNASDREIASVLKNSKNACGRFRANQLDRRLIVPKEKSSFWVAASAAVISFLTIGNNVVSAQTPVNTEQQVSETYEIIHKQVDSNKRTISGTVVDSEKLPIPGSNILIKGGQQSVQTDLDGKFLIEVSEGGVIQIEFIGMITQELIVTENKSYEIIMVDDIAYFDSAIFDVYGGLSIRRTFFGRIFHSIGNLFR